MFVGEELREGRRIVCMGIFLRLSKSGLNIQEWREVSSSVWKPTFEKKNCKGWLLESTKEFSQRKAFSLLLFRIQKTWIEILAAETTRNAMYTLVLVVVVVSVVVREKTLLVVIAHWAAIPIVAALHR